MSDVQQSLRSVLETIASEHEYRDYELQLKHTSSEGANYSSDLYQATISSPGRDDLKLFAKAAIINENIRSIMPFEIYEAELYFYTKLLERYKEIEERHTVPKEHRFVTGKFYGCDMTYLKEILVFDDLTVKGFRSHDRFKSYNWEYAAQSVAELAKLHSLSIALSYDFPEDYKAVTERFTLRWEIEKFKSYFDNATGMALAVLKGENRNRVEKFLNGLEGKEYSPYTRPLSRPVLAHGDFRPSNLMHRIREDGTLEVRVIDFQTLQISNPIMDLMYFIFLGSDEEFRARHYTQLVDHYHLELSKALARLGVNAKEVYPKEVFESEISQVLPYSLILSMTALPIVTVEPENAPSMQKISDVSDFTPKPNEIAAERLNGVINDFIKMGIL